MKNLFFAAFAIVLGATFVALFAHTALLRWRRYRQIKDTVTSRISMLRAGVFEVQGMVQPSDAPLISPLSRTHCIYYRFVVKERRRRRKSSHWATVIDDEQSVRCVLDDGTGRIEVPLEGAELHLRSDHAQKSGMLNDPPEELRTTLMKQYGQTTQGLVFNKTMAFEETILLPGDTLYVLGKVVRGGDRWRFLTGAGGPAHERLLISDRPEAALANRMLAAAVGFLFLGALIGGPVIAVGVALGLGRL